MGNKHTITENEKLNSIDSIQSIPENGKYTYLEYPTDSKTSSKNTVKGTSFSDGKFYYLVLNNLGLFIINNSGLVIDNSDRYDYEMLWPKSIDDTSYTNYNSFGLFMQTNGNLILIGNPAKKEDGTINGGTGTTLWNSGKTYTTDDINRMYTMRLEGKSIVVRSKYNNNIFSNHSVQSSLSKATACVVSSTNKWSDCTPNTCGTTGKQTSSSFVEKESTYGGPCDDYGKIFERPCTNVPCSAVNCVLTPSNADWGECSATQCGTKGTRQRNKYKVDSPSMYGGTCPSEFVMESTPCSAVPCPVNCTLSPSNALFSPCSATKCGTKGTRARPKYKVKKPSMYDGACDDEFEEEEEACSAPDCTTPSTTPSTTDENKKMYIIIGVVVSVLFLLIVAVLMIKK